MTNSAIQRLNMIECQIRPSDVTDQSLLRVMLDIPREDFLPSALKSLAYLDRDQPLIFPGQKFSSRRFLLAPRTLAKLLQIAKIQSTDHALDIGCGTGYSAAILSRLCQDVVALESEEFLAHFAFQTLTSKGLDNVKVVQGVLAAGHAQGGPFDIILLEGTVVEMLKSLLDQLKEGGRLVAILKRGNVGQAHVWLRSGKTISSHPDFDVSEPKDLPGFETPKKFVF